LGETGVLLKPKVVIDKQSVLSKKDAKKIKEALAAYHRGEAKSFTDVDDLIRDLNLYTLPIHELKKGVKLGDTFG